MKFTVTSHLSFLPNDPICTQFDLASIQEVKVELLKIINAIVNKTLLRQEQIAQILKIDQPKVSHIKHLKITGLSLERVFLFLLRLGYNVDLVINIPEDITTVQVGSNMNLVKMDIMYIIIHIITKYHLSQAAAAEIMLTTQPKISSINRLKTDNFGVELLLNFLTRMDYNVEILVKEGMVKERLGIASKTDI